MKFRATLAQNTDGEWVAECPELGASASGLSAQSALEALRAEIRYRIELCPCTSVPDDYVDLDLD